MSNPRARAGRSRPAAGWSSGTETAPGAAPRVWDACDPKAGCSKVGMDSGSGISGSNAIKMHGDGTGYLGMGWNLFGWYPANAGDRPDAVHAI